jgi:hypothetical protein
MKYNVKLSMSRSECRGQCSKQCSYINSAANLIHFNTQHKYFSDCDLATYLIYTCLTNKEISIYIVKLYLPFGTYSRVRKYPMLAIANNQYECRIRLIYVDSICG